ncbi:hypothetical protein GCM10023093_18330 [Nemorincola caseinilytica]|uniref:Secretion system C-terminal sorting domain-containing protein n=1 Tax=Nemorincola caseinilytica TaxID=2054315 RepID=A0ABP8NFZ2_9BACT
MGSAQSYRCVIPGQIPYFINTDGYLRGMRIDYMDHIGGTFTFYPYETRRDIYGPSTSMGSWFGESIVQLADGTTRFNTIWNDTVMIRTQAMPGDTWTFYSDTTSHWYQATVLSEDTMTFAGITDSVKTIRITSYADTTIDTGDVINGFEIVLSKNNGFVQIFDLHLFPYHPPAGTWAGDFYLRQQDTASAANFIFGRVEYHVPRISELHDFEPGDVFVMHTSTYREFPETYRSRYDSIISKTVLAPGHSVYRWLSVEKVTQVYPPSATSPGSSSTSIYAGEGENLVGDTSYAFATNMMPEEKIVPNRIWRYKPADTVCGIVSAYYSTDDIVLFEGGPNTHVYRKGYPKVLEATHTPPWPDDMGYHSTRTTSLSCAKKVGGSCSGTCYRPTAVEDVNTRVVNIALWPNPATTDLHVRSPLPIAQLNIVDMTGRVVYTYTGGKTDVDIDVQDLPGGVYMVRTQDAVQRFVKQ